MLELARILDAIDRNKSFAAAAKELHKVPTALSYTLKKHEERLNIVIFDRSQHRAELTPAGRVLLEQGRLLLQQSEQIEHEALQVASGWEPVLRVAYEDIFNTDALLQMMQQFTEYCPKVDLHLSAERLNGCLDALLDHRVDIALGFFAQFPPISEFSYTSLGSIEFVFVVAPTHPLAKTRKPLTPEKIKAYTTIYTSDTSRKIPSYHFGYHTDQQRFTMPSMELKRQAHIQGLGIGYMPKNLVVEDIKAKRLVVKSTTMDNPKYEYHLAWCNKSIGKASQWVLDAVQNKHFIQQLLG